MQKLKKPISILLSVLMVLSVFAVVPFTASATETFETLDLTQHYDGYAPKSFNGERFSVQVYGDEADISAGEAGWLFDGDYPGAYASISAMNGETITKIVVHRTGYYDNTLIVKADDNTISYSQNGDDFTYDNINASSVKLSADPDYPDECYCEVSSIDVYYTGGSDPAPTYTVTWKNDDGTTLETDTDVAEGTTPTYDGTTPEKAEDEKNTYTFAGWSPAIAPVTEDVTYTAQFDATPKTPAADASYVKVTSEPQDWSGDYLIVYEEGSTAFNGSSDSLNSSGNYIDVTISNGEIASDAATDAAKVTIAQIDGGYSIATATGDYIGGQKNANKIITSDDAMVNTISLDDEDYAVIVSNETYFRYNTGWGGFRYYKSVQQQPVTLYKLTGGSAPVEPPTVDGQVTWTQADMQGSGNGDFTKDGVTLTVDDNEPHVQDCIYDDGVNTFTAPGKTFSKIEIHCSYCSATPSGWTMEGEYGSGYTLTWTGNAESVTIQAFATNIESIVFTFAEPAPAPTYTVTWKNGDTVLETDTDVEEGATPTYDGADPTKAEDESNTYTFAGWSPEITAVTGDITYTAQFDATPKPKKLTLNVGENGKVVMDNGTFGNATDASNISEIHGPVNVADGYNASIANVSIVDGHTCNIVEGGSINIAAGGEVSFYPSADNTGKITATPDEDYALYGWYDGDTLYSEDTVLAYQNIDKTTTLTAVFAPAHTVTWKDAGGTILRTDTIAEGKTPSYGSTPTKANDDYHSYNFSGWTDGTNTYGASDTLPAVTGDVTYTAKYTVFTKQFTVFVKTTTGKTITANGVSGDTTVAELKDMVVEESGIPAAEQRLIFAGKEMENAKTLADYNIQKESTIHVVGKSYTVTWKNDDGSVIDTTSVAYGTVPTHNDGYKADDANYTYTFAGWSPEITAVTGDAEYTATFTAVPKGINYGGDNYIDPKGTQEVSSSDKGKTKFGLSMDSYLNMQMLGIQLKNTITTEGGDDGVRFVTAVNSNLLKGSNIEDYGYIVAKIDANVDTLYNKMDKFTAEKFIAQGAADTNIFTCKGSSNSISGEFGKYSSNTDYKYVTLAVTGTSGKSGKLVARFYVKTKDGQYHYADYINGSNQTYSGMAFDLSAVSANLG